MLLVGGRDCTKFADGVLGRRTMLAVDVTGPAERIAATPSSCAA